MGDTQSLKGVLIAAPIQKNPKHTQTDRSEQKWTETDSSQNKPTLMDRNILNKQKWI